MNNLRMTGCSTYSQNMTHVYVLYRQRDSEFWLLSLLNAFIEKILY